VLLNKGDGTFSTPIVYTEPENYLGVSVAIADLDGNGHLDVIAGNECHGLPDCYGGGLVVFRGNGDGTLQAPVSYPAGGNTVSRIAIADVNRDRHPDAVAVNPCGLNGCPWGGVSVYLGNGDGTLKAPITYDAGGCWASGVAIADINGDGDVELFLANVCRYSLLCNLPTWSLHGNLGVLLGNGSGTFPVAVALAVGELGPGAVAVADLNGDRKPDVVVLNRGSNTFSVLLNNFIASATLKVASSENPSLYGKAVTFTASLTTNPMVADGQTVTFYDGSPPLATEPIKAGTANFTTSALTVKTHGIRGWYAGDLYHKAASGSVSQIVSSYATSTSLTSSVNPSSTRQAVTFTAKVVVSGAYPATGQVKFFDGTVALGSVKVSGGIARLTRANLTNGTHPISAQYLGDPINAKSVSNVVNQLVQ
jgi:hypothetical protein